MKKVVCLLMFASLPAWADDVSGVWKVDGSIADHPITPTCTLKQVDNKISGNCKVDGDHVLTVEGSVKEKQVVWKYDQERRGYGLYPHLHRSIRFEYVAQRDGDGRPFRHDGRLHRQKAVIRLRSGIWRATLASTKDFVVCDRSR